MPYISLGCWKDTSPAVIPTLEGTDPILDGDSYTSRTNAIAKCAEAARRRNFAVFAVKVTVLLQMQVKQVYLNS